ncbi:MAG: helix-turn-helix domain-containing protein [Candidatus Humimicrobiaceae bacterium]
MAFKKESNGKRQILEQNKTLNKTPDKVLDANFKNATFFDPNDLMQVKYEMLRSAQKDAVSVSEASQNFGFSRISFYKIQKAFKEYGIAGLLPKQRGPRSAHKLNDKVMSFVNTLTKEKPEIKPTELIEKIKDHFNITVHKRSMERAILRSKKKQQKT